MTTGYAGAGRSRTSPPPDDGAVAALRREAPGGPIHVLLSDTRGRAHPGVQHGRSPRGARGVGGFDPQFRVAGDDVDICWRLRRAAGDRLQPGGASYGTTAGTRCAATCASSAATAGRGPARAQVAAALQRQRSRAHGAGRSTAGGPRRSDARARVLRDLGHPPFQGSTSHRPALASLPLMPEWRLCSPCRVVSRPGIWWSPLLFALPLLAARGLVVTAPDAGLSAATTARTAARLGVRR